MTGDDTLVKRLQEWGDTPLRYSDESKIPRMPRCISKNEEVIEGWILRIQISRVV
jgi:hypothetical protein